MDEERRKAIEGLRDALPLEAVKYLQELELYDARSSQEIIDEIYDQFESGADLKDEIVKPVFCSIIDGMLEGTSFGRSARKEGLSASRVIAECENFSYDKGVANGAVDGFVEYKNANNAEIEYKINMQIWETSSKPEGELKPQYKGAVNSGLEQKFVRKSYEDKSKMDCYKSKRFEETIGKNARDEYTGKKNITQFKNNPDRRRTTDDTNRYQAQTDHITPLKEIHESFKHNYALDDADIKRIANIDANFALTSAAINQTKKHMTNEEYISWREKQGVPLDMQTINTMRELQKKSKKAIDSEANKTVASNLVGKDAKSNEIRKTAIDNAASQAKDYAVGNLILYIVKPVYYEISDIFQYGMESGVGASSSMDALKIRFGRIKKYVVENAVYFLGESAWDFVKGFVSSLLEGVIGLFVGIFKQVLKIVKEGIKVLVESAKVLFGEDSKSMSPAQKGDAIIKILGGSVIAISGVAIESLLNKVGMGEPWSVILSTLLSGIAATLFMYILNKVDLFSVKAEKRRNRILEIFDERIKEIQEAADLCNLVAIETFRKQRQAFEIIHQIIAGGIASDSIDAINEGLYRMADFMNVDLPYSNTEEFCEYMDSDSTIEL